MQSELIVRNGRQVKRITLENGTKIELSPGLSAAEEEKIIALHVAELKPPVSNPALETPEWKQKTSTAIGFVD